MKRKFIIGFALLLAGLFLLYCFFFRSEIIVLDHMTKYDNGDIDQICLVKNPPASSIELQELIEEFNKNNPTPNGNFRRLFIKEHDYIPLPVLTLSENIDYSLKKTIRDDLDNIDFLGVSYSSITLDGDPTIKTEIYVSEINYYKK